ncbi:arginine-glutamic acid dipeptide repeats protein [Striga asiatica]|uniref:Arginine-glutamic acid dipeptide repeats protein n=1 Tax=Striga asiatica TaxID=4170 RepID=A0A5A7R642_STRAF|nr:arginine-glutamic acid dipeptide repeats protein [Striga asiatica]
MASIHFGENGDCSNSFPPDCDNFRDAEIPSDIHKAAFAFGEPEISPRTGDEYQAIVPSLVQSHSTKCTKSENEPISYQKNFVGLPILVMWISTFKISSGSKSGSNIHNKVIKAESPEELNDLPTAEKISKFGSQGYLLVPGLAEACWNALEKESFLLGLYIFEKNFVNVRRFVETKEMGDVLSFYYGRFYGSHEYQRWSDCRKAKGKKGIYGERIFSGMRQQELLNRILPGIPEESRSAVLEMSKSFEDEKISLEEYVFYLKITFGVKNLVDSIGIGKGKLDLTEIPLEPSRPSFPAGRAFSSLTTDEVIKILTGDYRLSKAKSNDIFWEAVWPRLLGRGWQTVVPRKQTGFSRPYLVYLGPGIKKFSRRKLVKGEHYFDSPTDILALVSKQPDLIVLDSERAGPSEEIIKMEAPAEKISEKKLEKICYLQPRTPKRENGIMKFTVIDTSLSDGNIRELRPFPPEISDSFVERDDEEAEDESKPDKKTASLPYLKGKKVESQTKKIPRSQKAKRAGSGHEGPIVKRCRMLPAVSSSENARPKFDLNLPQEAQEAENAELEVKQDRANVGQAIENGGPSMRQDGAQSNGPEKGGVLVEGNEVQGLNSNPLRLSKRTRALTKRVIEAVEGGYLMGDHRKRRARASGLKENCRAVGPVDQAHDESMVDKGEN